MAPLFTAGILFYLGEHAAVRCQCTRPCQFAVLACSQGFHLWLIYDQRNDIRCLYFDAAILTQRAGRTSPGKPSLMRNLITAYITITGIVEVRLHLLSCYSARTVRAAECCETVA